MQKGKKTVSKRVNKSKQKIDKVLDSAWTKASNTLLEDINLLKAEIESWPHFTPSEASLLRLRRHGYRVYDGLRALHKAVKITRPK
jgi:hypothetical protein